MTHNILQSSQQFLPSRLLRPHSPPHSRSFPCPFSIFLLITKWDDETDFTCKLILKGFCGCCYEWLSVDVKTESRPSDWLSSHLACQAPFKPLFWTHSLYPSPSSSPRLSPRPRKLVAFRLFQGAGLTGKNWQDDQGKLTPSPSCFMKVWQLCRQHRKEAAQVKKVETHNRRRERLQNILSSKVIVGAFMYPHCLLALLGHRV